MKFRDWGDWKERFEEIWKMWRKVERIGKK